MNNPAPTGEPDNATESSQLPPDQQPPSAVQLGAGILGALGFVGAGIGALVEGFRGMPLLLVPVFAIGGLIGGIVVGAVIGAVVAPVMALETYGRRSVVLGVTIVGLLGFMGATIGGWIHYLPDEPKVLVLVFAITGLVGGSVVGALIGAVVAPILAVMTRGRGSISPYQLCVSFFGILGLVVPIIRAWSDEAFRGMPPLAYVMLPIAGLMWGAIGGAVIGALVARILPLRTRGKRN